MSVGDLQNFPPTPLAQMIADCVWQEILVGCSTAKVFRMDSSDHKTFYLKTVLRSPFNSLLPEKFKLEWLKNKLFVPEVLMFAENENTEFLLLSEITGKDASDEVFKDNAHETVRELAAGLKTIHSLPIEDCTFDARLNYKIESARKRLENGLVDESDFDEIRQGRTCEDLFQELLETKPEKEELVFTHGDYCLPNVILESGNLSGFVDWGNAGFADKYQDIALIARSIESNFGAEWTKIFFEIYGIEPDWEKINFYQLLDEFF